jgi:phenylacetate-CoA ligase
MGSTNFKIYNRLPVFLQNIACSYYGWKQSKIRYNKHYEQSLNSLLQSEKWSRAQIEAYQNEKLSRVITHAYHNVPYYHEIMKARNLTPADIKTKNDLFKLPILTKEIVRNNFPRLISVTADNKKLVYSHTSGTTGKSLKFYTTREMIAYKWAMWWRHRHRFGLHFGDRHVNFTGKPIVPESQLRPPFWRWNFPFNQAIINMHHLTTDKINYINDFLNNHEFVFYSGYPSIIHALVLAAMETGCRLEARPKVITTGAENMYEFQKRDIEKYTKALLTDQYGFSEGCGNASQCPEMVYHEDFEYGIMECVDPEPLENDKRRGKIVCTGLLNDSFPFIRYEVGDYATWEKTDYICDCGIQSDTIVKIEGRMDDYVVTPEGRKIMRFDYIFKDTENIKESQIVQEMPDEIIINIVRRTGYSKKDDKNIIDGIHTWISPRFKVHLNYVNEIQRSSNGKFKAVISKLEK